MSQHHSLNIPPPNIPFDEKFQIHLWGILWMTIRLLIFWKNKDGLDILLDYYLLQHDNKSKCNNIYIEYEPLSQDFWLS
jgi:hypothetical protein